MSAGAEAYLYQISFSSTPDEMACLTERYAFHDKSTDHRANHVLGYFLLSLYVDGGGGGMVSTVEDIELKEAGMR